MPDHSDNTDSAATRYAYTNDLLAGVLILAFIGYVLAPVVWDIDAYPEPNALVLAGFVAGFGIAVAWAFGSEAVQAWQDYKNGGSE